MYNIKIELPAKEELVSKWCQLKGYMPQLSQLTENGEVLIDNPETELQFFQKMIAIELLNLYLNPIQYSIYNQANTTAQNQINELKEIFTNALTLIVEKETNGAE